MPEKSSLTEGPRSGRIPRPRRIQERPDRERGWCDDVDNLDEQIAGFRQVIKEHQETLKSGELLQGHTPGEYMKTIREYQKALKEAETLQFQVEKAGMPLGSMGRMIPQDDGTETFEFEHNPVQQRVLALKYDTAHMNDPRPQTPQEAALERGKARLARMNREQAEAGEVGRKLRVKAVRRARAEGKVLTARDYQAIQMQALKDNQLPLVRDKRTGRMRNLTDAELERAAEKEEKANAPTKGTTDTVGRTPDPRARTSDRSVTATQEDAGPE